MISYEVETFHSLNLKGIDRGLIISRGQRSG